jgi:hypothetical protein
MGSEEAARNFGWTRAAISRCSFRWDYPTSFERTFSGMVA